MDAVITYVNGLDPVWQESYSKAVGGTVNVKRFRDWGTLRYLLRGIERYMPFVKNVFLVVSSDSQVPEWVDKSVLRIVRHSDIIPGEYLPTFNSTTIEMFLHRIPGLGGEYLYFNDDLFPVAPMVAEDFFVNGKAVAWHAVGHFAFGLYRKQVKNASDLARLAAGLPPKKSYVRPQHTCSAMLRDLCAEAYDRLEPQILASLSRTRTVKNINQYLFSDYFLYTGNTIRQRISSKHFSMAIASAEKIAAFMADPSRKIMCVNDVNLPEKKYRESRKTLLNAFERKFPSKSRFELQ